MAIGLALSPLPVIAIFMLLMTPRASVNGPSFLGGWFLGIYVVGVIVFNIPGLEADQSQPTDFSAMLRIGVGVLLLIGAVRYWFNRPGPGDEVKTPKIFVHIDRFGFWKSFFTGILLSVVNVKNFALSAAGAKEIEDVSAKGAGIYWYLLLFTIIGSLLIIFPTLVHILFGNKVEDRFQRWKAWLIRNNHMLLVILLTVFGLVLINGGVEQLLS